MKIPSPVEIKTARQRAGFTLDRAAALVNVTTRTWQRWESGDRQISHACWELFRLKTVMTNDMPDLPVADCYDWSTHEWGYSLDTMLAYTELVVRARFKNPHDMSVQELQAAIAPLQAALIRKMYGDPTKGIGLTVK